MKRGLFIFLAFPFVSLAHEPIFGLGPGTIFKGGVGIETEYERTEEGHGIALEVLYGITEDFSITVRGFQNFRYLSEAALRLKYRFWKRYSPGRLDAISLIGGAVTDLGGNKTYALAGVAGGIESRRWYFFADVRTAGRLFFDTAVGIRPWLTEYLRPDLVLLSELNYEQKGNYNALFVSPAFFFTYRNLAIKGGVQIPVYRSSEAMGLRVSSRSALSVEVHF